MTDHDATATPAPVRSRRGGSGPEGRADRTGEYVISVGDVLSGDDPEPPAGTEVRLIDGSRWKHVPLYARDWPRTSPADPARPFLRDWVCTWEGITADGNVTIVWLPSELPEELAKLHHTMESKAAAAAVFPGPGQWRLM